MQLLQTKKGITEKGLNIRQKSEKVGGITLPHQIPVIQEAWMNPSTRPITKNEPNLAFLSKVSREDLYNKAKPIKMAERHGLAWVSGVSGSTNILLHQLKYLRDQGKAEIDINAYLLATLAFLVYDGGHSMQEVLYVANQLDEPLKLGLHLSDKAAPEEFVADYSRLPKKGAKAMEGALEDLVAYFHKNSYYSSKRQK